MIRSFLQSWIAAIFFLASIAVAQPVDAGAIPYKIAPTPVEEYGFRVLGGMLLFIAAAGAAAYFLSKKNPVLVQTLKSNRRIKVIERQRLNARCSLYVIEFDQQELLIGQSGDSIVCLSNPTAVKKEK